MPLIPDRRRSDVAVVLDTPLKLVTMKSIKMNNYKIISKAREI